MSDLSRTFGFDLVGREGPERVEIRRSSLGVSLISGQPVELLHDQQVLTTVIAGRLVASDGALPQRTP